MSENEQHGENDTVVENSVAPTIRENTMKNGYHEIFNNAVHHYQTPFEISLILEQASNCDIC